MTRPPWLPTSWLINPVNHESSKADQKPGFSIRLYMLLQYAATGSVLALLTVLFADRGFSYVQIARFLTASSALMIVLPWLFGVLSDRWVPVNRLLAFLNLIASLALIGLYTTRSLVGCLHWYLLYTGCAMPTFPLSNSVVFHYIRRPQQFGAVRLLGSVGWILPFGPIAFWLAWHPDSKTDFILLLGAFFHMLTCLVGLSLPSTTPGLFLTDPSLRPASYIHVFRARLVSADYLVLLMSMLLVSGSFSILQYFSPPFLSERGVARAWLAPAQAIGVVFEAILFQLWAAFTRRFAVPTLVLFGIGCLVLRHLLYVIDAPVPILVISYILAGPVVVFHHGGLWMLADLRAGKEVRSTAQTLFSVVGQGIGPAVANWAAGLVTKCAANDLRAVFALASVMALAAGLAIRLRHKQLTLLASGPVAR